MKNFLKGVFGGLLVVAFFGMYLSIANATVCSGNQGCTGFGLSNVTTTDVNKVLTLSSSTPGVLWALTTPSGGGSFTTTTINGLTTTAYTFSNGAGLLFSTTSPGTVTVTNLGVLSFNGATGTVSFSESDPIFVSYPALATSTFVQISATTSFPNLTIVGTIANLVFTNATGTNLNISGSSVFQTTTLQNITFVPPVFATSTVTSSNGLSAISIISFIDSQGQTVSSSASGTSITAGAGATTVLSAGNGGNATGTRNTNIGGTGGSFTINGGTGGQAKGATSTNNNGNGGSVNLVAGNAGPTGSNSGNGGLINITAGAGASAGGNVNITAGQAYVGGAGAGAVNITAGTVGNGAGGTVNLKGTLVASSANPDITFNTNATRSAGYIATFQNNATNKVFIDYGGGIIATASSTVLNNIFASGTKIVFSGIIANPVTDNLVCISTTGTLFSEATNCTVSSLRFKDNIQVFGDALSFIDGLHTISYDEVHDGVVTNQNMVGFEAENIDLLDPRFVVFEKIEKDTIPADYASQLYKKDPLDFPTLSKAQDYVAEKIKAGKIPKTVDYEKMTVPLVQAVQEQQKEIEQLQQEINALKNYAH